MRIAAIGTGRTGSEVINLLSESTLHSIFNSTTPLTAKALQGADIAIVFTPGNTVESISQVILEAKIPSIWGSTGFTWPSNMDRRLREAKLCWVHATNFSLGMVVMRHVLQQLGDLVEILTAPKYHLIESHHAHKEDSPSGTALSWNTWFGHPVSIESIRKGDVVGNHRLEIETENDLMLFEHQAKSRRTFAEGALWAAQQIVTGYFCDAGLHLFEEMVEKHICKEVNRCQD